MKNYYKILSKTLDQVAGAFALDETKMPWEIIPEINKNNGLPVEFTLIRLFEKKNGLGKSNDLSPLNEVWLDYQPNSLAWPFFSRKLRLLIDSQLTGNEGIDWVTAKVNGPDEQVTYFLPRFNKKLDVLDVDRTIYVPNTERVMKPFFSQRKIAQLAVFHVPRPSDSWIITGEFFVNDSIKTAIQQANLSGIEFETARVV